jgi:hypothetical protein
LWRCGFSLACFGARGSAEWAFPCVVEVVRRGLVLACRCADLAPAFLDALYPLHGRPVWAFCPCSSSFAQHAPCTALLHVDLADVGDLRDMHSRFCFSTHIRARCIPRVVVRRSLDDVGRMSRWLLLVVLELLVVGMLLCLAMTISSTFLFSPLFFTGREISLIHASPLLRTFLFVIPFHLSIPISLLCYCTSHIYFARPLPVYNVYFYILIYSFSFPVPVPQFNLPAVVLYPTQYIWPVRALLFMVSSFAIKHNSILRCGVGRPDLSGLVGEHTYIHLLFDFYGYPRAKFVQRKKRTLAACGYPENRGSHALGSHVDCRGKRLQGAHRRCRTFRLPREFLLLLGRFID